MREVSMGTCRLAAIERPVPRNSTNRDGRGALCSVPAFLHCGFRSMLQKNSESESVRNQQQRYYQSRKEECGSQLPRQEPGVIGLVESVQDVDRAPEIEDPYDGNGSRTGQQ